MTARTIGHIAIFEKERIINQPLKTRIKVC